MNFGTLEAGGTKMVLSIGDENNTITDRIQIPTETPDVTMPAIANWFRERSIVALGIGTFGPVDLNPSSLSYGCITKTPKLAWRDTPILSILENELNVPCCIDTDVNAAALAEYKIGAAKSVNSCLYITVGTGIGGGLVVEGNVVHGMMHPEVGHMLIKPMESDPSPKGFCPYHKYCLEGLASGPAIEKRWGEKAINLPETHQAWDLEADYLAQMCASIICILSPEKIILGGGVMQQKHLFPLIRKKAIHLLNGYIPAPQITNHVDEYIVDPGLGTSSGAIGALLLAYEAYKRTE